MKKIGWLGAVAAGLFAAATAVIGDIQQQKQIDEAIEKRFNHEETNDEDEEEES